MKIEMGESLFYSWLRHVKKCPIVHTNWKQSNSWELQNVETIEKLMKNADEHFKTKYDYEVFKRNTLSLLLRQAEIDVIGISYSRDEDKVYAVDVAYHEAGLNYGSKIDSVLRVVKKILRTSMCINGYFNAKKAEIIFAAPKITPATLSVITPTIEDINGVFDNVNLGYSARIIANSDFKEEVLEPIMKLSKNESNTNELFLRAYQLTNMFK